MLNEVVITTRKYEKKFGFESLKIMRKILPTIAAAKKTPSMLRRTSGRVLWEVAVGIAIIIINKGIIKYLI
jgi:hypothetical protein